MTGPKVKGRKERKRMEKKEKDRKGREFRVIPVPSGGRKAT